MKIAIAGTGYVGLSLAVLLSQENEVIAYDVLNEKVKLINNKISPIKDKELSDFLKNKELKLTATLNEKEAFKNADYVIISTPTDYNEKINSFNTKSVEEVLIKIEEINPETNVVIKSTIPVGFTKKMKEKYKIKNIFFSPEFLREGYALYDNLYPSRIVISDNCEEAIGFVKLLIKGAIRKDIPVVYTNSNEAEAIKLFANTYLAMRVAFFNELDTYAELNGLSSKDIINGVCLDKRIGNHYNNPSFGYGGYCLPKDTRQLLANYENIPNDLIQAIVNSNITRKKYIANSILNKNPKIVGVYRLIMKNGSDNFRQSAIKDIISLLKASGVEVIVYEPTINSSDYYDSRLINDIDEFIKKSDIILANRVTKELLNAKNKLYSRDIFGRD